MQNLLVDLGVGKAVETWLRQAGHDVKSIRDLNHKMSDRDILSLAVREKRIVVTMDKDFGELVYHSGLPHGGVLLLRLEEADSVKKVRVVKEIFGRHEGRLTGAFSVYQNDKLRIRN